MHNILLIGYGNPDRQDDGAAWHVLVRLAQRLGRPAPAEFAEPFENPPGAQPRFLFTLQLTPELAEEVARCTHACFVDAHTGAVPVEASFDWIGGDFQASPFTHHMTAQTLLAIAKTLYGQAPRGALASVRGYGFGFEHGLSTRTALLADQVVGWLQAWLADPDQDPAAIRGSSPGEGEISSGERDGEH